MNGCISLKFLFKSKTRHCLHKKNNKSHQQNAFLLKYYENCLKSDTEICKIHKSVRNIPRNNVIKDNITLFLKTVNKAINICIYKKVKNGYYAWWFISWFVKLLRVTNFDHKNWKKLLISKGKGYLCYKTVTSQNVRFEAQINVFFIS